VEFLFRLDGDRLNFRDSTVEAASLMVSFALPVLLLAVHVLFGSLLPEADRTWSIFLVLGLAVPVLAFFWGSPAAVGFSLIASSLLTIGLLINYKRYIGDLPWAILAALAVGAAAARLGRGRHLLDGRLAFWQLRTTDLESARNVLLQDIVQSDERVDSYRQLTRKLSSLTQKSSEIERSLSLEKVAEAVVTNVREILGRGRVMLYKCAPKETVLLHAIPAFPTAEEAFGEDFNPIVRRRHENLLIADLNQNYQIYPAAPIARKFASLMIVPLVTGFETWGLLRVESDRAGDFGRDDLKALSTLAIPATLALQNADLFSDLERRAVTDGLTGLFRRHYFDRRLEAEFARARRSQAPISLVFFDVDHFKSINDRFGHAQGDVVLKEVAAVLGGSVTAPAFAARYGGEEFVFVLPETPKARAIELAEQVRAALMGRRLPGLEGAITISAGVAAFPGDGSNPTQLTDRADAALYRSKREGRNRVTAA
jgi:diguanylate cyclase (GGDEF)-like protein